MSVDAEPEARKTAAEHALTFPLAYGADGPQLGALTGAFWEDKRRCLQATGFILKADGTVGIKTDCNSFFGTYALEMSKIVISPLGSTLMACPPNSMEQVFVGGLRTVTTVAMIGDANTLVLGLPDGRGSMTFTAVPRPQPMGY